MKKKVILASFALLATFCFFLVYKINQRYIQKRAAVVSRQTLPIFQLLNQDLTPFSLKDIKPGSTVCIFYYNADCEHCQYEATQISNNIDKFKDVQILMVSTNTPKETKAFSDTYKLSQYQFITWLYDKDYKFFKWFGQSVTPSIYIYNKDHKLIKEHTGELKIEAITEYINDAKKS